MHILHLEIHQVLSVRIPRGKPYLVEDLNKSRMCLNYKTWWLFHHLWAVGIPTQIWFGKCLPLPLMQTRASGISPWAPTSGSHWDFGPEIFQILPPAPYTLFEKQLLVSYWALIWTASITVGHPKSWNLKYPQCPGNVRETLLQGGQCSEEFHTKWKWFTQEHATRGTQGGTHHAHSR